MFIDFILAVDLGKSQDHTAIVLLGREPVLDSDDEYRLAVLFVEEVALGTPYLQVIEHVEDLFHHPSIAGRCLVVIDASGVGKPIMELFRAKDSMADSFFTITFSSGRNEKRNGMDFIVPKQSIVASIVVLAQKGLLTCEWDAIPGADRLKKQLLEFTPKRTAAGSITYEGAGSSHDDLVAALGVGCWLSMNVPQDPGMVLASSNTQAQVRSLASRSPGQLLPGRESIGLEVGFGRPER